MSKARKVPQIKGQQASWQATKAEQSDYREDDDDDREDPESWFEIGAPQPANQATRQPSNEPTDQPTSQPTK